MGELNLAKPVNAPEGSKEDHKYASREGKHRGIDYPAPKGTRVQASEDGLVVRAADNPKAHDRPKAYGNVIVIYHNPGEVKIKNRHIYTLYAHLDEMYVKAGDYVEKYETIGAAGSTGTSTGPHLHFEVIDSTGEKNWSPDKGAMGVEGAADRKNPEDYFDQPREAEGALPDMAERFILDRITFVPDIDLKRKDPFRLQAYLDGKNIGYVNKYNDTLRTKIKYDLKEELRRLIKSWRRPLRVPKSGPVRLDYEIRIR